MSATSVEQSMYQCLVHALFLFFLPTSFSKEIKVTLTREGCEYMSDILLESGTNELEVVEFQVGEETYGINVIKVREIIEPTNYITIPKSHKHVLGIADVRGEVIPIINLHSALGIKENPDQIKRWVITEMNQQKVAFQVNDVYRIHRIFWDKIDKPSNMFENEMSVVIGIITLENKTLLLLDFEKILTDINPKTGISEDRMKNIKPLAQRENKHILIAEDSPFLIKLITDTIKSSGYKQITTKPNGQDMWDMLEGLVKEKGEGLLAEYHCLITDIEMPKMDGLHLTKRVKEHPILKKLPVIIFSSLISDDLRHKGEKVGANAQITKPEIDRLVETLDQFLDCKVKN